MSLRLEISHRAETDLVQQYCWYLEHADKEVAERYLGAFDVTVTRLASHPNLGRPRKFRAAELADIRSLVVEGPFNVHLIFYRADTVSLIIERVIHGARDIPRRLLE